jgi:aconitate decarboxylase
VNFRLDFEQRIKATPHRILLGHIVYLGYVYYKNMATKAIATWALALQYTDLTTPVRDIAVKSIYNWAGCTISGYAQTAPGIAYDAVMPFLGAGGNSTILGTDVLVDAPTAALINGIASHVDDYDDTHRDNSLHPSGPVLAALLAVAEWKAPVSGEDFVTAFVAGVEAESKIGVAVWPGLFNDGWRKSFAVALSAWLFLIMRSNMQIDITSTVGMVGAAVAVGKVLGLDVQKLQQAISIASVQVTGLQESFGTDTKPFHVGRAAQNGLMAAILAQQGYSGSLQGLEALKGWARAVSGANQTLEVKGLGQDWEILLNTFKAYPCDRIIHGAIEGWIEVRRQALAQDLSISDITNVTARTFPRVLILTNNKTPKTGLEAKFSIYHAAAVALLTGEATPTQFSDEVVRNATVQDLRKKVFVTSDSTVLDHEAFVAVEFASGQKIEVHIENAIGSYDNPLSVGFLETKFKEQVAKVIGEERATMAYEAFIGIANSSDIASLVRSY